MLTQYAKEHGFLVVEVYVDDGWSGLNFDRPDFNRMLDDIEAGKIDVVITKDLSRLGRDHLKVGHFTEAEMPAIQLYRQEVLSCFGFHGESLMLEIEGQFLEISVLGFCVHAVLLLDLYLY